MSIRPPKRRVAITGLGAVSALGPTMASTWRGVVAGDCPAAPIRQFDASQFPCSIAYEVADSFALDRDAVTEREVFYLNRAARFGCNAALEAIADANLVPGRLDAQRVSVCLGVGTGSTDFAWHESWLLPRDFSTDAVKDIITHFPNQLSAVVARLVQAKGAVSTIHTACASSGQALGEAFEMIAYDEADVVVAGGADSMIVPFYLAGFCLLGALSKRNDAPKAACRPFDAGRDGFVMGEGAAMMVLEDFEHARRRGARILGEILGYGVTESAYRITDLHPEGHGPIEAMQMAIDDAGLAAKDVDYVNAHGTSTGLNDRVEALAIERVFPGTCLRVSSTKSMTGHMIAAAGAMELAMCVKALAEQVLPPSLNVETQDPECRIPLTPARSTPAPLAYALSNSVGFGGSNTAIVVGKGAL